MSDPTPWLSEAEADAWRAYLEATTRFMDLLNSDLQAKHAMTLPDYEILVLLSEQDDRRLRMAELADRVLVSRSRLTYRVDRLVKKAWLLRESCPADGRSIWAVLTDDGYAALAAAAPDHVTAVRRHLLDHFDHDEWLALGERFSEMSESLRKA